MTTAATPLLRGEACMNAAGIATSGRVLVTGGGARSPAYRQLADLTGRGVTIASTVACCTPQDYPQQTNRKSGTHQPVSTGQASTGPAQAPMPERLGDASWRPSCC